MEEQAIDYYQQLYSLHAQTKLFKKRIEETKRMVSEYLELGIHSYVSISGGKDSTVLAHIVNEISPNIPLVSVKDEMDFPNEREYLSELQAKYKLNLTIIEPKGSMWEFLKDCDFTEDIHSQGTDFSDNFFYDLLLAYKNEMQYKGVFLGLREQESKGRAYNGRKNGFIYYNQKWKQLVCQPLIHLSAMDIFAYLFSNDIPIFDIYFKTKFMESPENIRKSWILPSAQSQSGAAQWLKWYYPDLFNKLASINYKMRAYV